MKFDFDEIIDRRNTNCIKYDDLTTHFNTDDVIPLWVADMDFRVPPCIAEAIKERANHEIFGYTFRSEQCHNAIQKWMLQKHGWEINKEWLSSSPGVVTALSVTIQALTNPGDKIAIQPPVYHPFFEVVKSNDRQLVYNKLIRKDNQYYMDFDNLEKLAQEGLKMIIICNPHNPVGRVWSAHELEKLSQICSRYNLLVLSDEIHSDLIFEEYKHIPIASVSQDMAQRTITCIAPSKTFNVAGMSSSSIIIPNSTIRSQYDRLLHTLHLDLGNLFGHVAMEAGYNGGAQWLKELMLYLKGNMDFIKDFLSSNLPDIQLIESQATYLLWIDFSSLKMTQEELQHFMIHKAKVAMNSGNSFGPGGEGFLRMNIGCPRSVLNKAMERIKRAIQEG